jgi:hypothetical protein
MFVIICLKTGYDNFYKNSTQKILFYAHHQEQVLDVYNGGELHRFLIKTDTLKNIKFGNTLHVNYLKNRITKHIQIHQTKNWNAFSIKSDSITLQLLLHKNALANAKAQFIYVAPKVWIENIPQNSTLIVPLRYQKKYYEKQGYKHIYCLQEQGALEL